VAEKSFETPNHFLEYVVTPNLRAWREDQESLRLAFNAVMSIDSYAAHILEFGKEKGCFKHNLNDSNFKKEIGKECDAFQIVSDVAKALKHVKLNNKSAVVKNASDTTVGKSDCGLGTYGSGPYNGNRVITIVEENKRPLLDDCLEALEYLESFLKGL